MRALVRRPSPQIGDGLVTHITRRPVDMRRAQKEWEGYVGAFERAGWEIVEAPPLDDCPDGVFVEDVAVVAGAIAVATRPGAPERRAEVESVEETLRNLGYDVGRIDEPGTLDGGDVLTKGKHRVRRRRPAHERGGRASASRAHGTPCRPRAGSASSRSSGAGSRPELAKLEAGVTCLSLRLRPTISG